jgi:Glycosyl hydrolase catalytic core
VLRYAWFSADSIPNANLINSDGTPTALGQMYIDLPQNCP